MGRGGEGGGCVWGVTRMKGAGLRLEQAETEGGDTRIESTALCLCSLGPGPGGNGQPETDKELYQEQILSFSTFKVDSGLIPFVLCSLCGRVYCVPGQEGGGPGPDPAELKLHVLEVAAVVGHGAPSAD